MVGFTRLTSLEQVLVLALWPAVSLKPGYDDALLVTLSFSHTHLHTHISNDNITHGYDLQLRKQRVPVFESKIYCYLKQHFDSTCSLSLSPSGFPCPSQLWLHTLEILHNYYLSKSCSLYSPLVAHILIWTFHSTNIDKTREIESTQLSITTFPVLSMPLIFALWKESHSHSYFYT